MAPRERHLSRYRARETCNFRTHWLVGVSKFEQDPFPNDYQRSELMSPRKTILKALSKAHQDAPEGGLFTRPSSITGFSEQPDKYQKAVNELLQARLVEGRRDDEGKMTIALNVQRLVDVRRELRPIWARPAIWAAIAIIVALGAGLTAI